MIFTQAYTIKAKIKNERKNTPHCIGNNFFIPAASKTFIRIEFIGKLCKAAGSDAKIALKKDTNISISVIACASIVLLIFYNSTF